MKTKTIKLEYWLRMGNLVDRYRVVQVTNSVEYAPNDWIGKSDAESLCRASGWQVTIVPKKGGL